MFISPGLIVEGVRSSPEIRVEGTSAATSAASADHVDTCGVHFPRLMSDADALEHPAASAISESFTPASLGRMSRRNSSGS
jgi:hypothetical protein